MKIPLELVGVLGDDGLILAGQTELPPPSVLLEVGRSGFFVVVGRIRGLLGHEAASVHRIDRLLELWIRHGWPRDKVGVTDREEPAKRREPKK